MVKFPMISNRSKFRGRHFTVTEPRISRTGGEIHPPWPLHIVQPLICLSTESGHSYKYHGDKKLLHLQGRLRLSVSSSGFHCAPETAHIRSIYAKTQTQHLNQMPAVYFHIFLLLYMHIFVSIANSSLKSGTTITWLA